ncbi:transposase [Megasphaera paucivorans]|uniref:transposase n=1 Tax=Megasphaera paucivorans TaxID=349095 RepID=UPI003CCBBD7E
MAEIGNIHHFASQASVAKFAGLVWTQHHSGDFEASHTHLIQSGNCYLRYYLLEAANSVKRCDSEFQRYYDLKFREVNQFQHTRFNCKKTSSVRLSSAEGQSPVYPTGTLSQRSQR